MVGPAGQKPVEPDTPISLPNTALEKVKNWIDGAIDKIASKIFNKVSTDAGSRPSSAGNLQGLRSVKDVTAENQRLDKFFIDNLMSMPEISSSIRSMASMLPSARIQFALILAKDNPRAKEMLSVKHEDPALQQIVDSANRQIKEFDDKVAGAKRGSPFDDVIETAGNRLNKVAENAPRESFALSFRDLASMISVAVRNIFRRD